MGSFQAANGQIIDPNGNTFVARGINIYQGQVDANTILSTFPGINMIRVATIPGNYDPSSLDSFISTMTANHVVVEIEDHHTDGSQWQGNALTGQALTNEENWYSSVASQYKNNPYVWFGTANEPTGNNQGIVNQEVGIYNAIRSQGTTILSCLSLLAVEQQVPPSPTLPPTRQ